MIIRDELESIAKYKNLTLQNAERDYILELLLSAVYRNSGSAFAFKGGTALYKVYGLNRFSEDLDFTLVRRKFKVKECFNYIVREFRHINLEGLIKEFAIYPREINSRLFFKGPLYRGSKESLCSVTVNITLKERIVLEHLPHILTSLYKEIPAYEVYVLQPEELLAEKVRAIFTREKARDVYDLWFLLKRGTEIKENIINRKLKLYNLKFDKLTFLKKVSLQQRNWHTDLTGLIIGRLPDFEIIKTEIGKYFEGER